MCSQFEHMIFLRVLISSQELPYQLLRQLTNEPAASQRSLATRLGVSLGKLNFCLKALVDKGWVKANNFRRSDNKLGYAYVLTPSGIEEKGRLTQYFLQRKLGEFEALQQEIESLRREESRSLIGDS